MKLPLLQVQADSTSVSEVNRFIDGLTAPLSATPSNWASILDEWIHDGINMGIRVVLAVVLFLVGRIIIRKVTNLFRKMLARRNFDGLAISLLDSLFVALLYILLGIVIATALGVKSVSFAAVLASFGLAVGMALSGQLQNLAGGVIILLTKPFSIGEFIEAQGISGTVRSVSLFHTLLTTPDNKQIYVPNGTLSSGLITNYSGSTTRRIEWVIGFSYDEDYERVRTALEAIIQADGRILRDPDYFIGLSALADSSVNVTIRAWVKTEDYWSVFFDVNKTVYAEFNRQGISFPFPQLTVHQAK